MLLVILEKENNHGTGFITVHTALWLGICMCKTKLRLKPSVKVAKLHVESLSMSVLSANSVLFHQEEEIAEITEQWDIGTKDVMGLKLKKSMKSVMTIPCSRCYLLAPWESKPDSPPGRSWSQVLQTDEIGARRTVAGIIGTGTNTVVTGPGRLAVKVPGIVVTVLQVEPDCHRRRSKMFPFRWASLTKASCSGIWSSRLRVLTEMECRRPGWAVTNKVLSPMGMSYYRAESASSRLCFFMGSDCHGQASSWPRFLWEPDCHGPGSVPSIGKGANAGQIHRPAGPSLPWDQATAHDPAGPGSLVNRIAAKTLASDRGQSVYWYESWHPK